MKQTPQRLSGYKIAHLLNISSNTVSKYLGMEGAPKKQGATYDVEEATAWIRSHTSNATTAARVNPDIKNLKERELTLKCDRLEVQINKEKDRYVLKAKLGPLLYNIGLHQRNLLQQKLERDLANIIPGITPEVLASLRETTDSICSVWREGVREFVGEVPACPKCQWKDEPAT